MHDKNDDLLAKRIEGCYVTFTAIYKSEIHVYTVAWCALYTYISPCPTLAVRPHVRQFPFNGIHRYYYIISSIILDIDCVVCPLCQSRGVPCRHRQRPWIRYARRGVRHWCDAIAFVFNIPELNAPKKEKKRGKMYLWCNQNGIHYVFIKIYIYFRLRSFHL